MAAGPWQSQVRAPSSVLSLPKVKVWFQNRRIKWRKQSLEQQQAKLAKMGLAAPQRSPDSQSHRGEEEQDLPAGAEGLQEAAAPPAQTVAKCC